jgi:hypothetical protein
MGATHRCITTHTGTTHHDDAIGTLNIRAASELSHYSRIHVPNGLGDAKTELVSFSFIYTSNAVDLIERTSTVEHRSLKVIVLQWIKTFAMIDSCCSENVIDSRFVRYWGVPTSPKC